MQVKIVNPIEGVTLYFCPNCLTGHQVNVNQNKCDICGIDIEWPKHKGTKYGKQNKRMFANNSKNIRHKTKRFTNRTHS